MTEVNGNEIVTTRIIDFPVEVVFNAWTDPEQLAQWWGPKDFTNTFEQFDLKPGGDWIFVMHGPNGADYPNKSTFVKIDEPNEIVFDHVSGHHFRAITTFEDTNGKTKLIYRMIHASVKECDKIRSIAMVANEENFDKLETLLAKITA